MLLEKTMLHVKGEGARTKQERSREAEGLGGVWQNRIQQVALHL